MSSIYNRLSKEDLEAKLKETSKTAPEYSDIQAAIEKKQEEIKSDLAKELGMTSWGKPSEEFNELFEHIKSEKDGGASLKELMHPGYGIFKNKDPDTIRSIYNIAKLPGKNIIDASGGLETMRSSVFPEWEDIKKLGTKAGEGIIRGLQYFDPFGSAHAATNQKKDDFTFKLGQDDSFVNQYALAEEQMGGSNKGSRSYHPAYDDRNTVLDKNLESFDRQFSDTVYDDIGQYANRKIPGLEVDHRQNTDLLNDYYTQGEHYITYAPKEAQTW